MVANQRVSLVGSGFFAGAKIGDCDDCGNAAITIGGDQIAWPRINGNDDVNVDNGGNWSAAVDLPLTSATTASGRRTIRVTDSKGRTGTVDITIPGREVTITPTTGRVGTQAVVRGKYFPSKNDDGDSFNVVIIYDAGNGKQATVTAVPDASGRVRDAVADSHHGGHPLHQHGKGGVRRLQQRQGSNHGDPRCAGRGDQALRGQRFVRVPR